ncbi:MAG: PKD domain-containing protein, partial [Saprospiraceae bacterium]|nr:PKD domain-containing protein [Saprospiraceae bacterium]
MRVLLSISIFFALQLSLSAQCTYLAYDGFNYAPSQALQGLSGGTGWQAPWTVQNNNTSVPGYQTQGASSLTYTGLTTLGIYGQGGSQYLTSGRRLNTSQQGPFANYLAENSDAIGSETGDTLWLSVLFNKISPDDQQVWLDLHDNNIAWCSGCSGQHIGLGYFGSNSNVNGQRRWTLRLGDTYYPTDSLLTLNETTLLVVQIVFNPGNTQVALFVNPPLGYNGPGAASLVQNTGAGASIRSAAVYLGNNANSAAIDEFRFAASYPCVAPDNNVAVNLPPTAAIAANPVVGQRPLMVNFNANSSTDPEGGNLSYLWNFGDGSSSQTGAVVNHTFTALGELTTSLLVTDPLGLQHTAYQTITVTDENGRFPCQTSFTSLQMAACNQNNGQIRINTQNTNFTLRNQVGNILPITNGDEYHQLSPGQYTLIVNGISNSCYDSMTIYVITDSTTCQGWQPSSCAMQIGTNLGGFSDWSVERPLKNLLKHVRSEILTYEDNCFCWNSNVLDEISLDPQGYPTHAPQTTSAGTTKLRYIISADGGNFRRDSSYLLLYDGVGTISFGGAIGISSSTPGRIAFTALDNGNVNFNIEYSDILNPVRNIRIVRPQHENVDLYHDAFYEVFKEKISPFQTLRFMDWGNTNGNTNVLWADRAKTD